MAIGLFLLKWDKKLGPLTDIKYPNDVKISDNLINKVYTAYSFYDEKKTQDYVEIYTNNLTILSFCDMSQISEKGYELSLLILEEKDRVSLNKIKQLFIQFSKEIFQQLEENREKYFNNNLGMFFKQSSAKKILLLGRAGTGKTSIKKIIFEGVEPKVLLLNPLEPTRGISPNVYSWLDLKLGIFDSSGQELSYLLNNEDDSDFLLAFKSTDIIVYVMDYTLWHIKKDDIESDIKKISQIILKRDLKTKLVLFVHKIDLIEEQDYNNIVNEIKDNFQRNFSIDIQFTSIHPKWIYSLYNAFYDLLSSFSQETLYLRSILKDQTKDISKTTVFLTNLSNAIIVQSISKDFNTSIINYSHKLIAEINENFEDMSQEGKIDHLILSSDNNFNIIMNNLNMSKYDLKYIIVLSESLSANKLILLVGQIRLKLKDFYYLEKKVP